MNESNVPSSLVEPVAGRCIWECPLPFNVGSDVPRPGTTRVEFPDLIRFHDHWFCAFREGAIHSNHPSGVGCIIHSPDGDQWQSLTSLSWQSGDVREPKFSITAEGQLMINTSVYFVSDQPQADGVYRQLEKLGTVLDMPLDDEEWHVAQQSVTWLSPDGFNWSSAYACPTGVNTWRWATTWHNGMGYSVGQWGKDTPGTIYRTRDGKSWRVHKQNLFPEGHGGEGSLAFTEDDTAICLLRGDNQTIALLGIGKAPYYQDWQWKSLRVDWHGDGNLKPINEVFRVQLGGPKIIRLSDGRLLGAGRTLPPERPDGPWRIDPGDPQGKEDGRIVLFWIEAEQGIITRFAEMDGTTYPGVVEHDGELWVTYLDAARKGIHLARLPIH